MQNNTAQSFDGFRCNASLFRPGPSRYQNAPRYLQNLLIEQNSGDERCKNSTKDQIILPEQVSKCTTALKISPDSKQLKMTMRVFSNLQYLQYIKYPAQWFPVCGPPKFFQSPFFKGELIQAYCCITYRFAFHSNCS